MDMNLFQPGDKEIFGGVPHWNGAPAPIDAQWQNLIPNPETCISLLTIQQAMSQLLATDPGNSARASGRPAIKDIGCSKVPDPISVRFYEYLLRAKPLGQGKAQPSNLYVIRNSGSGNASLLIISLRDALLSSMQLQTQADGNSTEQFSLNFTEVIWTHVSRNGGAENRFTSGWSLVRNRPIALFTD